MQLYALVEVGDLAGALKQLREELSLFEALHAADPNDVQARRNLSLAHKTIGDVLIRIPNDPSAPTVNTPSMWFWFSTHDASPDVALCHSCHWPTYGDCAGCVPPPLGGGATGAPPPELLLECFWLQATASPSRAPNATEPHPYRLLLCICLPPITRIAP